MFRIAKYTAIALVGVLALAGLAPSAEAYDAALNARIVQYAQSKLTTPPQTVRDGECWSFVDEALAVAGAHRPGQGGYGTYTFGESYRALAYFYQTKQYVYWSIEPGDVIQFEGVKFVYPNGQWFEMPHHTAIVSARSGSVVTLIHQNFGSRTVSTTVIDLTKQTQGSMTFFHPAAR